MPCIFVGDGPMRSTLERLAARAGIADRVVFTGALERREVSTYYSGAEALVLPSVSEGVPLVAVEALGAGVPVVASNLTGIASVVRHRENGLLVDPGDQAALTQALALIEADQILRAVLRQGACDSKGQAGTWPEVVNKLSDIYIERRALLSRAPTARYGERTDRATGALASAGLALGFSPALALAPAEVRRVPEATPPLVVFLVDAFRHDFLSEDVTPHLAALAASGLRRPLKPILGYSDAIRATFFTGR